MNSKVVLCALRDAPARDAVREMTVGQHKLCVANIGGVLYAMDNECPHRLGPLGEGVVEDGAVLCPWHGWAFDPVTGGCKESAQAKVKTYPVEIEGEVVLVEMERAV